MTKTAEEKQSTATEQRIAAEKRRIENRFDKQIQSLKERKQREIESLDRRASLELRRLRNIPVEKPVLN